MSEQGFSPEQPQDPEKQEFRELNFPDGWKDILESPDAIDYQHQIKSLIDLTQQNITEEWAKNPEKVQKRWQHLIERTAYASIAEDDLQEMTQSEIVETALITTTTNLEELGWIEEGKSFEVLDLATGEPLFLDITE